jgi:hypothetical protein
LSNMSFSTYASYVFLTAMYLHFCGAECLLESLGI